MLDHLHRCLTTWLAPVLCFTAEEAWTARFGDAESVHLQLFPDLPPEWRDDALAAKWERIREIRKLCTNRLEAMRAAGEIGSSLQAWVGLGLPDADLALLSEKEWAELLIVSVVDVLPYQDFQQSFQDKHKRSYSANHPAAGLLDKIDVPHPVTNAVKAPGTKCVRCWRVLPEVGSAPEHPSLCLRCADAVESGLVCRPAA